VAILIAAGATARGATSAIVIVVIMTTMTTTIISPCTPLSFTAPAFDITTGSGCATPGGLSAAHTCGDGCSCGSAPRFS
jgi:hypothetical protein